ncbi:MAG TPA: energy transducer TonB [Candidatus Acidoferrales bacterium]|nr:energy transducer TonB [Candidatus Acidoferrales bacterium]
MSVDPSTPVPQISLPVGNRQGEFTLSRPTEKVESPGSPNGAPENKAATGQGGKHAEETPASTGILTVDSKNGKAETSGALGPSLPPNMVFPVHLTNKLRRNATVVSTGATGGGGLDVYGALHCSRIYTIFLSMPGKNWTMQYCNRADSAAVSVSDGQSAVIQLHQGLLPPDPEAQFDYRRLAVPADKLHKMIVLKGILREDGTVGALQIYQGVLPQMDEVARTAFSRWRFKPAMQNGRPVPVEILVGIPTEAPAQENTH